MCPEAAPLDADTLRAWIGRQERATDVITPRLEASLRAILDTPIGMPQDGDVASPTIHWCLAPPIVPSAAIGADGHPARGGFLPPVPLPRRMWAGGRLSFVAPLRVGDLVTRDSTIEDVVLKTGRTGSLCFVTVVHALSTARGPALEERHDIVYRDAAQASGPAKAVPAAPAPRWHRTVPCDPVVLFRYSALTFNGHRIHYDRAYATSQEGYSDLVVHGPLQVARLLDFAAEVKGVRPSAITYRGINPLFATHPFSVNAIEEEAGLRLWAADAAGRTTMEAHAVWS